MRAMRRLLLDGSNKLCCELTPVVNWEAVTSVSRSRFAGGSTPLGTMEVPCSSIFATATARRRS